jgi:hypothetical protein
VVVVPVVGSVPLQPPEAAQVCALAAFHCSVTEAPMTTLFSLAFNVTDGGATGAGGGATGAGGGAIGAGGGTTVSVPAASTDCVWAEYPHAASALSAANPSIDFNANAVPKQRLRRIELIMRLPRMMRRGTSALLLAFATISEITYSFDILKLPTCRHLQTTYVEWHE